MNRIVISIVLWLSSVMAIQAQGIVKGKVLDKQSSESLQFVNVTVSNAATGKLVKGAITDVNGNFNVSGLPYGKYVLGVSFVGYKSLSRNFTLSQNHNQEVFSLLYLAEDQHMIKEVEVKGQRSQMKLEVDRKTFTVDQVLAAAGGTASDLLENIPSVEVSTEGEVSLRGNTSVEVWINGKASGLTTDNRGEILQQIPAESIEKIEVIDNPSAKYSPEGSAGIINIILKRDRSAGYYGSLRAGVNTRGGYNGSGNINYSSGVLDAYANIGYRKRKGGHNSLGQTEYFNTNQYQNYRTESDNKGRNLFTRAGLTWHATKNDDLSLSGILMHGKRDDQSLTPYHYGTIGTGSDSRTMYRDTRGDGDMNMYHAEADYTHKFGEGHSIDLNVSFDKWKSDMNNYYRDSTEFFDQPLPTTYSYQYMPMFINNRSWEAKVDYENKLSESLKLEAGYDGRFSHENTPQMSFADNTSWNGDNAAEDKTYYNRFIYDIDVHAAYLTLNAKLGNWGVMAGLRGEYWQVNTKSYDYDQDHGLATPDQPFKKDFFQLFPSLFVNYNITQTSQVQLNYTRRLRRPWGGELNSVKNTRDATMIAFGNPELTPEYTHSFGLNYMKTWDNHTLSLGTYYRPTTDVIQRVTYNDGGVMYQTNKNVAKSQRAGAELILKDKLWRVLDLTTTLNAYYYKLDGFTYHILGNDVTGAGRETFSWDARILAGIILPYDISVQLTGNYRSRSVVAQGYQRSNASMDFGLRKSFLNKKFTLTVNWRDVFSTRKRQTYTSDDSFARYQENWHPSRGNISLTWNFGNMNQKPKAKKRNETDADSEGEGGFGGYE